MADPGGFRGLEPPLFKMAGSATERMTPNIKKIFLGMCCWVDVSIMNTSHLICVPSIESYAILSNIVNLVTY